MQMIIQVADAISSLSSDAVRFWTAQTHLSVFNSYAFYVLYERTVLAGMPKNAVQIMIIRDKHELIRAILPLDISREYKVAKQCNALTNYYFPRFTLIARREDLASRPFLDEVAGSVVSYWSKNSDAINLLPLNALDPVWNLFESQLRNSPRWQVQRYHQSINWVQPVDDLETYFQTRPVKLVNTLKRQRKKAEKAGCEFVMYSSPDDVSTGLKHYWTVYEKSWKVMEPFPELIGGLCQLCAENGSLRLGVILVDQCPASAQIWIVKEGTANIFKLAYDPEFSKYSVGSLLTENMIRAVCTEDGVSLIDFLNGDDPFKQDWMSEEREVYGLFAINRSRPVGLIWSWAYALKPVIKRIKARLQREK